ncbi:hypothetical protein AJ79_03534 [Helicocarpus griseus UAMH5409]|uniref:Core domain-containing protein n=1 Tax=Helicocarpus griseus UAMH5409 TaxID=1447875 RepID=A0A2B7XXL5_9EURO|nr:hypothetical protein AJ79_03534 [Helicocarpus griseus UAMH5409]
MNQQILTRAGCRLAQHNTSSAAIFVQQSRRALSIAANPSPQANTSNSIQPVLPFLVPRVSQPANSRCSQGLRRSARVPIPRPFSTTQPKQTTTAILNPRTDEEGKPLMVKISPRAAKRLREITDPSSGKPSNSKEAYDHLRVTVSSGGCHGFQYLMTLDPASKIDPEEDTVFEADPQDAEKASPDGKTAGGEAKVVMDSASLELLHDSTIDYTMELIGSQFKIVDNPRATSSCGCGTSFDVNE